ncbi:MAG: RecX family transcriptional regulator [Alistipes sp.]|nr:RecX family transcriptional regulator [Alistipes sp.]
MRNTTITEQTTATREKKPKSATQALQSLMRLCARAEKSSGDAMRLMRGWGVPETEREGVLAKLIEQRFIDDHRYAEAYVREKSNLAGWGARKIAFQLRQKGISKEIISATLATVDGDAQLGQLTTKLERKMRTTKASNNYELRGKLLRYGLGLGFDYDMILTAIDKITPEE